jgi:hypothetical protein
VISKLLSITCQLWMTESLTRRGLAYDWLAQKSGKVCRSREFCMDVLSEVLKVVKLQGAMFYNGEFSSPWSYRSPPSRMVAPYLAPGRGHVILYHLLTEGRATARLENGKPVALVAGDIAIFPHGDAHIMENGPPTETVDMLPELSRILSQGLKLSRFGGGGEVTRFICGYMACDPQLSQVLLNGLPRLFKVSICNHASGKWLEDSILFSVNEAGACRAGGEAVLAKLSEVLFVETLRAYIACLPAEQTGWLAGVRDSDVGKTLALMHRNPAHPWTIATLAREAGISRSVLAERFRHYRIAGAITVDMPTALDVTIPAGVRCPAGAFCKLEWCVARPAAWPRRFLRPEPSRFRAEFAGCVRVRRSPA